jgi:integrase
MQLQESYMASRTYNFTTKICEKLSGPEPGEKAKEIEYTDMATSLKLLVSKNRKTWYYRYTINGKKRPIRIGVFPGISVEEARKIAIEYGAMVDRGIDPQSQRDIAKGMPTFEEFANNEYMPYAIKHKRSADMDESKLRLHMLKVFGHKRICDISRRDIDMYRTAIAKSHSNATSNRHVALLSRMLGLAIAWERGIEKNPCTGIKKLQESSDIGRALKSDEIQRLKTALDAEPNRLGASAVLLLMYSGLRHAEVLTLPWSAVDLKEGTIFLSHTKSGKSRHVTLNSVAIDLLKSIKPTPGSPWVFPGVDPKKSMNNIRKVWMRALASAKVKHARIHDLRHSFGGAAAVAGVSLYTIQKMLGHASSQTTQRYAHLADSRAMREASMAAVTMLTNTDR